MVVKRSSNRRYSIIITVDSNRYSRRFTLMAVDMNSDASATIMNEEVSRKKIGEQRIVFGACKRRFEQMDEFLANITA